MFDTIKKVLIQNREDDALLYEYVLTEIENEVILKGLWAKAMALSECNDNKIQALYMQYRVQSIKDELTKQNIAYKEMSKEEERAIWEEKNKDKIQEDNRLRAEKQEDLKHQEDEELKATGYIFIIIVVVFVGILYYAKKYGW